ncbi:aa3 type cytochrome c oxidase subunit IV [Hephaestia caeni]|uniref:Aa3 type cytochrome c oxidase subunit IV n=1 Tax=Hephaestia caeni TaxID=645617 RepID=A0A397NWX9_9SPHN|nr:aa3-type cytochrome c oxidase subunit IV [Hephaestia caeni]RIA37911.1 aa3 type cytochrome c oxidase subunit IV [Hephaestia caeni]
MAGDGNIEAHEATYATITALFKWSAISLFLIALIVMWLIS